MDKSELQNEFSRRMKQTVDNFIAEYDVTVSELIGCIEVLKMTIFIRAYQHAEEEEKEKDE